MTAADLKAWADRKMGGSTSSSTQAAPLSIAGTHPPSLQTKPSVAPANPSNSSDNRSSGSGSGSLIPEFTDAPAASPLFMPLLRGPTSEQLRMVARVRAMGTRI
jgi:hypothetical protein